MKRHLLWSWGTLGDDYFGLTHCGHPHTRWSDRFKKNVDHTLVVDVKLCTCKRCKKAYENRVKKFGKEAISKHLASERMCCNSKKSHMKLLVIINDGWNTLQHYYHTGILQQPKRRTVEIELTKEQEAALKLKVLGHSNGKEITEDIESVSVKIEEETPLKPEEENIDYDLKKGDTVWFTFKIVPREEDWIRAEILDLNWAHMSAAISLEGYKGVTSTSIKSLHKQPRKGNEPESVTLEFKGRTVKFPARFIGCTMICVEFNDGLVVTFRKESNKQGAMIYIPVSATTLRGEDHLEHVKDGVLYIEY